MFLPHVNLCTSFVPVAAGSPDFRKNLEKKVFLPYHSGSAGQATPFSL